MPSSDDFYQSQSGAPRKGFGDPVGIDTTDPNQKGRDISDLDPTVYYELSDQELKNSQNRTFIPKKDILNIVYGDNISARAADIQRDISRSEAYANDEWPLVGEVADKFYMVYDNRIVAGFRRVVWQEMSDFVEANFDSKGTSVIDVADLYEPLRDILAALFTRQYPDLSNIPLPHLVENAMEYGLKRNISNPYPEEKQLQAAIAMKDFSRELSNKIGAELVKEVGSQEAKVVGDSAAYHVGDYIRKNIDSKGMVNGHDAATVTGLMLISNEVFEEAGRFQFNQIMMMSKEQIASARKYDEAKAEKADPKKFAEKIKKQPKPESKKAEPKETKAEKEKHSVFYMLENTEELPANSRHDAKIRTAMNVHIDGQNITVEKDLPLNKYLALEGGRAPNKAMASAQDYENEFQNVYGNKSEKELKHTRELIYKEFLQDAMKQAGINKDTQAFLRA